MSGEVDRPVIEGVVMSDDATIERLCEGMVESMTEFDWAAGRRDSLSPELRDGLRRWARELLAWDRANPPRPTTREADMTDDEGVR